VALFLGFRARFRKPMTLQNPRINLDQDNQYEDLADSR
jgi:hypothetical protein